MDATWITLEQADILSLAGRGERFDIIESVGVLQHLEDPLRGWRILRAHPEEGAEVDLDAWHDFETRNPTNFVGLYQFRLRAV